MHPGETPRSGRRQALEKSVCQRQLAWNLDEVSSFSFWWMHPLTLQFLTLRLEQRLLSQTWAPASGHLRSLQFADLLSEERPDSQPLGLFLFFLHFNGFYNSQTFLILYW